MDATAKEEKRIHEEEIKVMKKFANFEGMVSMRCSHCWDYRMVHFSSGFSYCDCGNPLVIDKNDDVPHPTEVAFFLNSTT